MSCFCKRFEFHLSAFYFPSWLEVLDHFENLLREMGFSLGKCTYTRVCADTHALTSIVRKITYILSNLCVHTPLHICIYTSDLHNSRFPLQAPFRGPSSPPVPRTTAPGSPVAAKLSLCTGWPLGCLSGHHSKSLWCSLASGQRHSHCSAHFLI